MSEATSLRGDKPFIKLPVAMGETRSEVEFFVNCCRISFTC